MTELFDVITAINRLKDKVAELSRRVDFICRYPAVIKKPKYISEKGACKMLKISRSTLWRLRAHNILNSANIGRKILYRVDDITEFLRNNTKHNGSAD